jgi:LysM repeat protein
MAGVVKQDIMIYSSDSRISAIKMLINPDNWNLARRKIENRYVTKGGVTFQHWGEDVPTITISGYTDVKSTGTKGLELLNQMWLISGSYNEETKDYTRVSIVYKGIVYTGHIASFNYRESVDNLYLWRYDMSFLVEEMTDKNGRKLDIFENTIPADEGGMYPQPTTKTTDIKPTPGSLPSVPYVVKSGDTLSEIAQVYGMTTTQLWNYKNNRSIIGEDPDLIITGAVIEVPAIKPR